MNMYQVDREKCSRTHNHVVCLCLLSLHRTVVFKDLTRVLSRPTGRVWTFFHLTGRVGSGQEVFNLTRIGSSHPDPTPPIQPDDPTGKRPWVFYPATSVPVHPVAVPLRYKSLWLQTVTPVLYYLITVQARQTPYISKPLNSEPFPEKTLNKACFVPGT